MVVLNAKDTADVTGNDDTGPEHTLDAIQLAVAARKAVARWALKQSGNADALVLRIRDKLFCAVIDEMLARKAEKPKYVVPELAELRKTLYNPAGYMVVPSTVTDKGAANVKAWKKDNESQTFTNATKFALRLVIMDSAGEIKISWLTAKGVTIPYADMTADTAAKTKAVLSVPANQAEPVISVNGTDHKNTAIHPVKITDKLVDTLWKLAGRGAQGADKPPTTTDKTDKSADGLDAGKFENVHERAIAHVENHLDDLSGSSLETLADALPDAAIAAVYAEGDERVTGEGITRLTLIVEEVLNGYDDATVLQPSILLAIVNLGLLCETRVSKARENTEGKEKIKPTGPAKLIKAA